MAMRQHERSTGEDSGDTHKPDNRIISSLKAEHSYTYIIDVTEHNQFTYEHTKTKIQIMIRWLPWKQERSILQILAP